MSAVSLSLVKPDDGLPRHVGQPAVEELAVLSEAMARIVLALRREDGSKGPGDSRERALAAASEELRRRRRRDRLLGGDLFADPAWNILLDLYVADAQARRVSLSSAWIAAAVPTTTGARCCRMLEMLGLATREQDPSDRRRWFFQITDLCREKMTSILAGDRLEH